MQFGSPNVGENGEHNGVGYVEISIIFAMQFAFFFGAEPFDGD